MNKHLATIGIILIPLTTVGAELKSPSSGSLYPNGDGQGIGLSYQCTPTKSGLECAFTQLMLLQTKTPQQQADELDKAARDPEGRKFMDKLCTALKSADKSKLDEARAVPDGAEFLTAVEPYCASPTDDGIRRFIEFTMNKEAQTCNFMVHPYKLTFQRKGDAYVSLDGPAVGDDCGEIISSKFESPEDNGRLWSFETRRIVTNRTGTYKSTLLSCKDLEEFTQSWVWDDNKAKGIVHHDCKVLKMH